ncbi:MAG TPA: hypothetical protein VFR81_17395 [Longimicrobium sp.]|nr:hypothetical protein [Longimicrobium sp.]
MGARSRGPRRWLLVVLPLAAAALAVFLLLRAHAGVLEVVRGPRGPELRSMEERRAMLADGWCAVSRNERRIVGRLEPGFAPGRPDPGGLYPVQRTDVRASERVDSAQVWIVSCPQAQRGQLPPNPATGSSPVAAQ